QRSLKQFPLSPEPLDLRFRCHIGVAADYWLLARFADADAQLNQAEKLVASVKTERNLASLNNARAALILEKAAVDIESDYQELPLLENLGKALFYLEQALAHHKKTGSGEDFLTATIDLQISQFYELHGRVLRERGNAKEAKAQFEKSKE